MIRVTVDQLHEMKHDLDQGQGRIQRADIYERGGPSRPIAWARGQDGIALYLEPWLDLPRTVDALPASVYLDTKTLAALVAR